LGRHIYTLKHPGGERQTRGRQRDILKDIQKGRQKDGLADRQRNKQTEREADRHTKTTEK